LVVAACCTDECKGKPAFALYQPGVSLFDYFGLPENTEEDKAFNKMMNTFTQGVDQASLLHVMHCIAEVSLLRHM
jgi:hypothetical protein